MSVGECSKNTTARYISKIGGKDNMTIVLPESSRKFAESYSKSSYDVYIYDQNKYINEDFEFFGFRPRNCGGVGRQGIAEAVEELDDGNTIFLELDDDTSTLMASKRKDDFGKYYNAAIKRFQDLKRIVEAEYKMCKDTGCLIAMRTGAGLPNEEGFISARKIFNNFIMFPKNKLNFDGFKALCSDDYRFNYYTNLTQCRPTISHNFGQINFAQNQGDRDDGNAPLYNSDFSWKKSFALKMMFPAIVEQRIVKEEKRVLFRENISMRKAFPPILLSDENGKIVGRAF
jgi:hypothetical protein